MRWLRKKRVLLVLVLGILVLLFAKSDWLGRVIYPVHYQSDIQASAQSYGIEPQLLAAIVRVETNYKTGKTSRKGALGIMQIMPDTAAWIVEQAQFRNVTLDDIHHRADIGIELGAWYIASLLKQFDDRMAAAAAAYNAGPGSVRSWLNEGRWDGTIATSDSIPYGETRHYVQRVYYYYNTYKTLYPDL